MELVGDPNLMGSQNSFIRQPRLEMVLVGDRKLWCSFVDGYWWENGILWETKTGGGWGSEIRNKLRLGMVIVWKCEASLRPIHTGVVEVQEVGDITGRSKIPVQGKRKINSWMERWQ